MEKRKIEIGKKYRHFKGNIYQVIDIVNDSENENKLVIYKGLYENGKTWAREYNMFNSEVDHIKYPDVKDVYRFTEIDTKKVVISGTDNFNYYKDFFENKDYQVIYQINSDKKYSDFYKEIDTCDILLVDVNGYQSYSELFYGIIRKLNYNSKMDIYIINDCEIDEVEEFKKLGVIKLFKEEEW